MVTLPNWERMSVGGVETRLWQPIDGGLPNTVVAIHLTHVAGATGRHRQKASRPARDISPRCFSLGPAMIEHAWQSTHRELRGQMRRLPASN
jgi:hypothetical protein